jgi:hypothetical protein
MAAATELTSAPSRSTSLVLGDEGSASIAELRVLTEDRTALVWLGKSDLAELATAAPSALTVWASERMDETFPLLTSLFKVSIASCRSSAFEQNSGSLLPQPADARTPRESNTTTEAMRLLIRCQPTKPEYGGP